MRQCRGWGAVATFVAATSLTSAAPAAPSYSFVKIADNGGLFDTFPHGPSINDHGEVVFTARLDGGGAGYFVGPDPLLDRAVTGSGYNGVGSHRAQINNAG